MTLAESKRVIRRELRQRRQNLSKAYTAWAAYQIAFHCRHLFKRGLKMGAYIASGSELNLDPLIMAALQRRSQIYLPQINKHSRRLWFTKLDAMDRWYVHPRYRIPEYHGERCRAERLDVLLMPLIGVDAQGYRLGQGGGFYDTTLDAMKHRVKRPMVIGVAYDCQRVDKLPTESWDQPVDYLLTESGLFVLDKTSGRFIHR